MSTETTTKPKPKTNAQRIADLRARRKAEGLKELTNLWAHPDDHAVIKAFAQQLEQQRKI